MRSVNGRGLYATEAGYHLAQQQGVSMPITEAGCTPCCTAACLYRRRSRSAQSSERRRARRGLGAPEKLKRKREEKTDGACRRFSVFRKNLRKKKEKC